MRKYSKMGESCDNSSASLDNFNELKSILSDLNIETKLIEHEEVFTVDAMMVHLKDIDGLVCKNLFVKDKKKKHLWLIVAKHDRTVSLNDIAKKVGASGGFRFADEKILFEKLGVTQGCVTPLAIYKDKNCDVTVILDSVLSSNLDEMIFSHPMVNSASVGMTSSNFLKFLRHFKHEPILVDL